MHGLKILSIVLFLSSFSLLYSAPKPIDAERILPAGLTFKVKSTVEGYSVRKRPILSYQFGQGKDTVVYFGVFHGDEGQGKDMLLRLMEDFARNPDLTCGKRVIVVPVINPDGYAKNKRTSARGVDLNRNFQTADWTRRYSKKQFYPGNRKPEPETRAIMKMLKKYRPSAIVTLHAYLHCNNFDGPAEAMAFRMAQYNHYKVRSYIGYKTPGSFGTYAGKERKIPVITLELSKTTIENSWDRHREALLDVLRMEPGELDSLPENAGVFSAAAMGDLTALTNILRSGTPVNDREEGSGWTPLLYAAYFGHIEMTKWLLEHGADVNLADRNGGTPLMFAAQNDHDAIVDMLLKKGAQVNAQDRFGNTALMEAGRNANLDPLILLLAAGADLHRKDAEGKSVLIDAARGGYLQTMRLLLEHGADINERDATGRTPLMESAERDFPSMVRFLVDSGADLSVRDVNGRTALMEAKRFHNRNIVSILKKAGQNLSAAKFETDPDKTGK